MMMSISFLKSFNSDPVSLLLWNSCFTTTAIRLRRVCRVCVVWECGCARACVWVSAVYVVKPRSKQGVGGAAPLLLRHLAR